MLTVSNKEVTLNRPISMLPIAQKLYVGGIVIYVRCINCSYNNVAKGIGLLDKKHFCLYMKFFMQVKAFERYISLMHTLLTSKQTPYLRRTWWATFRCLLDFDNY